jgi:hypothetical protein
MPAAFSGERSRAAFGSSTTHPRGRLSRRATEPALRRLHPDPERGADVRPAEAVLVPGVAYELGAPDRPEPGCLPSYLPWSGGVSEGGLEPPRPYGH